jgi:hypothetical protein
MQLSGNEIRLSDSQAYCSSVSHVSLKAEGKSLFVGALESVQLNLKLWTKAPQSKVKSFAAIFV